MSGWLVPPGRTVHTGGVPRCTDGAFIFFSVQSNSNVQLNVNVYFLLPSTDGLHFYISNGEERAKQMKEKLSI